MSAITKEKIYDVVVIGGGPSGMMAAGRAAETGARVLLIEKNEKLGKKLLISGGGRCNVLNGEPDPRKLALRYGPKSVYLHSAFARFGMPDMKTFLHSHGVPTIEEAEHRMFPQTQKAETVWHMLAGYMKKGKVDIEMKTAVRGFEIKNNLIAAVVTDKGARYGRTYILASGGASHPETGSTGDGFGWLSKIGHTVTLPSTALVPIKVSEQWISALAGVAGKDVKVTRLVGGKKVESKIGKILFTHVGMSGPLILNMSKSIGDALTYEEHVTLVIDFFPKQDVGAFDKTIQALFAKNQNKKIKNCLTELVPKKLTERVLAQIALPEETAVNGISRDMRRALGRALKEFTVTPSGLLGKDKAVITSGGVVLTEIDFKTLQSKKYPNLFVVGDMLDFDKPTGGFSLQLCWTTGFIAGESSAKYAMMGSHEDF